MSDFVCPEGARLIALSGKRAAGREFIVSEEDYAYVSQFNWFLTGNDYVARAAWENGKNRQISLHRSLAQPSTDQVVDHVNGNKPDNRRENLRCCSSQENRFNSRKGKRRQGSSFKGVHPRKGSDKFEAVIVVNRCTVSLGRYATLEAAALAYDAAARYFFGPFAQTNFPGDEARSPEELRLTSDSDTRYAHRAATRD